MGDRKRVHVIGGGTFFHVQSHLSLAAPAFGETARRIYELSQREFPDMFSYLHLTRMAGGAKNEHGYLETNQDVANLVARLVEDPKTKVVFFNVAMTDFEGQLVEVDGNGEYETGLPVGKYAGRASTHSGQAYMMELTPAEKVITEIRKSRKDITLVAFKTTCGATEETQGKAGLHLLKRASANLVLANDVKTRLNMIITPEEAKYHVTKDREDALKNLVEMAQLRSHLTFTRSTVVAGEPIPWTSPWVPRTLRVIVNHCIKQGAYKVFNGSTVGHFAAKINDTTFITSRRKTNFNELDKVGLVQIETDGPDSVVAYGSKPSVGGQSQRIVFHDHQEYDCIVHFHCPLKEGSPVPVVSQREFECGSHECGKNTSNGLQKFTVDTDTGTHTLSAVFLDQHGPNIVFNQSIDPNAVIDFIEANFDLKGKTGGYTNF